MSMTLYGHLTASTYFRLIFYLYLYATEYVFIYIGNGWGDYLYTWKVEIVCLYKSATELKINADVEIDSSAWRNDLFDERKCIVFYRGIATI